MMSLLVSLLVVPLSIGAIVEMLKRNLESSVTIAAIFGITAISIAVVITCYLSDRRN